MARQINKLTARTVSTVTKPGYHSDGGGLYLQVTKSGSKTWLYRFTINGKTREMGLGSLQTVSLANARELATDARKLVAAKNDPIEDRDKRSAEDTVNQAGATFREVAEAYIARNETGWKNPKHRQQWRNTLSTYVYPKIGNMHVAAVEKRHVLDILNPIWTEKTETARRVRSRIETVLDVAIASGARQADNPALFPILKRLLPNEGRRPKSKHHAALPYEQISEFMADLNGQGGIAAIALKFIVLTGVRTSEAFNATWDEVDLEKREWIIPEDRMKAGKEHRVPLSDAACEILEQMPKLVGNDHIFPGQKRGKPLSNMACLMLLKRLNRSDLTVHGFRSTFRDWAADTTSYPNHVAEAALAHGVSDKVEAAYRRSDLFEKRRQMMQDWADFCGGLGD